MDNIKGVIFDCDGVLVNSESISCYALNILFEKQFGIDIGSDYSEIIGTSVSYALEYYLKKNGLTHDNLDLLAVEKEKEYFKLASRNLESFENCESFIQLLQEKSIKIAVASSGSHEKIEFSLNKTNLLKYFDLRCSSSDVKNGKPAPDLFIYALKKLGLDPSNCIVVEDSITGVTAAVEAGMRVIAFPGSFSENQLKKAGGYYVKNGYSELIQLIV